MGTSEAALKAWASRKVGGGVAERLARVVASTRPGGVKAGKLTVGTASVAQRAELARMKAARGVRRMNPATREASRLLARSGYRTAV